MSYWVHYGSLLQDKADINTETALLLQNASGFLSQNPTVVTKYADFITKCRSYYKISCLLQNASVQVLLLGGRVIPCVKCLSSVS